VVVNVGDSRCVRSYKRISSSSKEVIWITEEQSTDHKPQNKYERLRIQKMRGIIEPYLDK